MEGQIGPTDWSKQAHMHVQHIRNEQDISVR
jgi:hypothetical protein